MSNEQEAQGPICGGCGKPGAWGLAISYNGVPYHYWCKGLSGVADMSESKQPDVAVHGSAEFTPMLLTADTQENLAKFFDGRLPDPGDSVELYCYEASDTHVKMKYRCTRLISPLARGLSDSRGRFISEYPRTAPKKGLAYSGVTPGVSIGTGPGVGSCEATPTITQETISISASDKTATLKEKIVAEYAKKISPEVWERTTGALSELIMRRVNLGGVWDVLRVSTASRHISDLLIEWAKKQGLRAYPGSWEDTVLIIYGSNVPLVNVGDSSASIAADGAIKVY